MTDLTEFQKSMVPIDYMFKRKKAKNDQPERIIHRNICDHIQNHYPDIYFMSDPSGIKLSPNILKLLKATRSAHAQLDIVILHPTPAFKALILEVKAYTPYRKNGELFQTEHLQEQYEVMRGLSRKGYRCDFVWSLEQAVKILEQHIGKPISTNEPLF